MRRRLLDPGFFTDDELATCHPLARLLFAGLWCAADSEGRLEDRPRKLKAEILPYDDCDADCLLEQLSDAGSIVRYAVEDKKYIAIPNFLDHQHPHYKEPSRGYPAPLGWPVHPCSSNVQACSTEHGVNGGNHSPTSPEVHPFKGSESISISEKTLRTHVQLGRTDDGDEVEGEVVEDGEIGGVPATVDDDSFDAFWSAYPRKENRLRARTAWNHINKGERTLAIGVAEIMAAGVAAGVQERRFVPHPTTFIHGKRWEDWREGVPAGWQAPGLERAAAQDAALAAAVARAEAEEEPA